MILNRNILFALLISVLFFSSFLQSPLVSAERFVQDESLNHDDLWDRVRSGFSIAGPIDHHAIRKLELPYARNPKSFNLIVKSSEKYLFYIVEEIERRGMPLEIALLPIIESAYNPLIKSNNQSAGLWQFVPSTGKLLGLEQNVWHDDRRDIIASTNAALDYLQYLHKKFNDWKLAIAAYNLGEGTVSKVLSRSAHKGRSRNFFDLNLPIEGKQYVYRLLAVKDIIANSKKYGIKLRPVPNRPYFETVKIHEPIDISLVTRLANISESEFTALNPAYNRYVIKVATDPRMLVLPKNNKNVFLKNLETYHDPRVTWQIYHVKKNENINEIATRFQTTVKQLKAINGISRDRNLTLGQKILVPQVSTENVANGSANIAGKILQASVHVVKSGDTLSDIAKRYGTTVKKIKTRNNASDLFIGQELVIVKS